MHPDIVATISHYFGMLPILENISLIYSPNNVMVDHSSQYYHLDAQDVTSIQLFVYVEEVDETSGPLIFIRAQASERVARRLRYRKIEGYKRLPDESVHPLIDVAEDIRRVTGPSGYVFGFDADRCFHQGSRAGARPRLVVALQYCTPFAFALPFRYTVGRPFASLAPALNSNPLAPYVLGVR